MTRIVLLGVATMLLACTARATGPTPFPAPVLIDEVRESVLGSLPLPSRIPEPDELNCRDMTGEITLIEELPRAGSLPARAMWVMPNVGDFPLLVLEPGAESSRADTLRHRRTPGEFVQLIAHHVLDLRLCSREVRDASQPVFDTLLEGLIDPRGQVLELVVRPVDPREPMQVQFAACMTEKLERRSPKVFRHSPGYTHFEFPFRFTGRPDFNKHRIPAGCPGSTYGGLGAVGECRATDQVAADELTIADPLVEFVEHEEGRMTASPARSSLAAWREHTLASMRAIEDKVAELEACRPSSDEIPIQELMIKVDMNRRIEWLVHDWDTTGKCLSDALVGSYLPLTHHDAGTYVFLTLMWSTLPLGISAEEQELLVEDLDYPPPDLLASPLAAKLCPPELGVLHEQIANGFGRVGEAAEFALHDLSRALLLADPATAHACVHVIADALAPVLTWPAPVEGPVGESVGLHEAAARTDTWRMVLAALDGPIELRHKLGCFLRRADFELMGTVELRDEESLPSDEACGLAVRGEERP